MQDDAIIILMPAIVKAGTDSGRRMVEVEASYECVDLDGDIMLQEALLESADTFVASGHLDIEHISELGMLWNIADPSSYIVGRPIQVKDIGDKRTSVIGQVRKSSDGVHDSRRNRYDEFWDTLQSEPAVAWQASVFGYPKSGMVDDCRSATCEGGATRFVIRGFDWRSLAFTRQPRNHLLKGHATIVSAKAFAKASPFARTAVAFGAIDDLWEDRSCPDCLAGDWPSTVAYRKHFEKCRGIPASQADIFAHALMHRINKSRVSNFSA